jgi:hypothetical protein
MMGQDLTPAHPGRGEGRALIVSNTDPMMPDPQESARTPTSSAWSAAARSAERRPR